MEMTDQHGGLYDPEFDQFFGAGADDGDPSRARNRRLGFWFVAVALVVVAATVSPALAVASLLFGWDDFLRARRLMRDDPSRVRGTVCARFSIAWGCIKVSLVATALMFAIANIQFRWGPGGYPDGNGPPALVVALGLVAMFGLGVSALVASLAVVSALWHGLRVWVGGGANRAKLVIASAFLTWVAVLGLGLLCVALAPPHTRNEPNPALFSLAIAAMLLLGNPVSILVVVKALEGRVVAKTPGDCWGKLPAHRLKA